MALGLFAQIGLLAHLYSVMVPATGAQAAGWFMASITAASLMGRSVSSRVMSRGADRRVVACASYGAQVTGSLVLLVSAGSHVPLLLVGIVLFGVGVGNATSLPPLIAQTEFAERDVQRVVARVIALAQGAYAFAPAIFGLLVGAQQISGSSTGTGTEAIFVAAALVQVLAVGSILIGRRRHTETP